MIMENLQSAQEMTTSGILRTQLWTRLLILLLLIAAAVESRNAVAAFTPITKNIVAGYSDCSVRYRLATGYDYYKMTIDLKGFRDFPNIDKNTVRRGILVYLPDRNGKLQRASTSSIEPDFITLNNAPTTDRVWVAPNIVYLGHRYSPAWGSQGGGSVPLEIMVVPSLLNGQRFIAVRMVAFVGPNLFYDDSTILIGSPDMPGSCSSIDPNKPLPTGAKITMTAPDWDLGTLTPGASNEKWFALPTEQLCFTYDGPKWAGLRYAINATNQNGLSGNGSYQLKHLTSPADTVPYRVVLQNATTSANLELPNARNVVSALGNGGRECFSPKFTADTPKAAKEGNYGDVLTFTITAQP